LDNTSILIVGVILCVALTFSFSTKESFTPFVPSPTPSNGELVRPSSGGIILNSSNYSQAIRLTGSANPATNDISGNGTTNNEIQFYVGGNIISAMDVSGFYMVDKQSIFLGTSVNYLQLNHSGTSSSISYSDSFSIKNGTNTAVSMDISGNSVRNGNAVHNGNLNVNGSISYYGNQLLPIGTIVIFYSSNIPAGWALCDGRTVTRTDGGGSITTPNLVGSFVYGGSTSNLTKQGNSSVTLTTDNLPSHSHTVSDSGHTHNYYPTIGTAGQQYNLTNSNSSSSYNYGYNWSILGVGYGLSLNIASQVINYISSISTSITTVATTSSTANLSCSNTGNGYAFSIMPPYITLCYIMKY